MDFKYIIALFVGIIVEKTIQRINMYLLNAKYKMFLASLSKEDIKLMKQVENDAKEIADMIAKKNEKSKEKI